jgi:hypothetical protein
VGAANEPLHERAPKRQISSSLEKQSIATPERNHAVGGFQSAVETVVGILGFFAEYGPSAMIWLAFFSPLA